MSEWEEAVEEAEEVEAGRREPRRDPSEKQEPHTVMRGKNLIWTATFSWETGLFCLERVSIEKVNTSIWRTNLF